MNFQPRRWCNLLALGGLASRFAFRRVPGSPTTKCLTKHLTKRPTSPLRSRTPRSIWPTEKSCSTAPASWVRKTPRVRFIEHEFAVPASKDDKEDGRVTVMGAGGSVEANIDRWIAQFKQPDGSETKNQVPEADRKQKIAGLEVQRVDLTGTFHDSVPFDPTNKPVDRENYRMLAAIVVAPKLGNYFIKFYGPKQTVGDHAEEFHKMIAGLQLKCARPIR